MADAAGRTENNPEVMDPLAAKLGLGDELRFYDVYALDEPALLAHIPRPAAALLVIIPMTEAWGRDREAEDAARPGGDYDGRGPDEPVVWFRQTIGNACGSIGLLHCAINGPAAAHVRPGSDLARLRAAALPLGPADRADLLYHDAAFEAAHKSVEKAGDTAPSNAHHEGQHFVAYVKAGGRLWELEGSRPGPLDRGALAEDEDVLSPRALELGLGRIIKLNQQDGASDLRFSCMALAPTS